MTDVEKYIAGQKACGIEVGDTVRVVRKAKNREGSWFDSWVSSMDDTVGENMEVNKIHSGSGGLQLRNSHFSRNYPYFVLEIVKKKDGSVPDKKQESISTRVLVDKFAEITNTSRKESNMSTQEQTVFDVTVVERSEVLHEGSGFVQKINRTILFDHKVPAVSDEAAKQKALASCKVSNFDDLEITCRPFC